MSKPNPKTVAGRLDLIRDRNYGKLTNEEIEALIIAANIVRENPDFSQKHIDYYYK